jgi:hypothetical protein
MNKEEQKVKLTSYHIHCISFNPNYIQFHSSPPFEPLFRTANGLQTTLPGPQNIQQTKSISHDPQIISIYRGPNYQPFHLGYQRRSGKVLGQRPIRIPCPWSCPGLASSGRRSGSGSALLGGSRVHALAPVLTLADSTMQRSIQAYMKVLLKNEMRIMGNQEGILAKAQVT